MMDMEPLIAAATAVRERAYAPHSGFAVGAAILDEHGNLHCGCNVENAAYPQSQCAEASAIGVMIAAGGKRIAAIAIAGPQNKPPCAPCGGCRQRIREFAEPQTPVLICAGGQLIAQHTLIDLLPHSFGPDNLA